MRTRDICFWVELGHTCDCCRITRGGAASRSESREVTRALPDPNALDICAIWCSFTVAASRRRVDIVYWGGEETWRDKRSKRAFRRAFEPGPDLVGGLASMKGSPLLRERMESGDRSEFMVGVKDKREGTMKGESSLFTTSLRGNTPLHRVSDQPRGQTEELGLDAR